MTIDNVASRERQLRDVGAILAVSGDRLDYDYLDRWAKALDIGDA